MSLGLNFENLYSKNVKFVNFDSVICFMFFKYLNLGNRSDGEGDISFWCIKPRNQVTENNQKLTSRKPTLTLVFPFLTIERRDQ